MAKQDIHPSAIIEDGAKIGQGVRIGPFEIRPSDEEFTEMVAKRAAT